MAEPKFPLGRVVVTEGAQAALERSGQRAADFVTRHSACDWSDMDPQDAASNLRAIKRGGLIRGAYWTSEGETLWLITTPDRSQTLVLIPEEAD